jgi:biotin carboxyl carrier protein
MSKFYVKLDQQVFEIEYDTLRRANGDLLVRVADRDVRVRIPAHYEPPDPPEWIIIDDRPYEMSFERDLRAVTAEGQTHRIEVRDAAAPALYPASGDGRVKAPIPGVISQILVAPGASVRAGQPLLILDAMKMENQIRAPRSGVVASINVELNMAVGLGQLLAEII